MKRIIYLFLILAACSPPETKEQQKPTAPKQKENLVKADGKSPLILLTDRPPNLETPLKYFLQDYTPNNAFFVRWHLSQLPDKIQEDTFRLRISGNVNKILSLSLNDLKTKFKPVTIPALCCCAGNARSTFDPAVPGAQWKNGAMGNAKWTGIKLKDILQMAGLKPGSTEVAFNGMDTPPLPSVPDFVKALKLDKAMDDQVIVAYEMNGEPIPFLNGYPLKLVVPGWYATYWVGMLNEIKVYNQPFTCFWMTKAYKVPKGVTNGNESHDSLANDLVPISKMDVRAIFVSPTPDSIIKSGAPCDIQGLAFDGGDGIAKVELSEDNGKTWKEATLEAELGKYSWRRWHYQYKATTKGEHKFKVKATTIKGETQPEHQWNRSGYMRNEIETLTLKSE
jgi:hypothetical protein